jgi:predicted DNA-binding transcriptional regulator AlpA
MQHSPIYSINDMEVIFNRKYKSLWRWVKEDENFPKPLKRNGQAIGFLKANVDDYILELAEQSHKGGNHESI